MMHGLARFHKTAKNFFIITFLNSKNPRRSYAEQWLLKKRNAGGLEMDNLMLFPFPRPYFHNPIKTLTFIAP
jgi:hypothetical protein